MHVFPNFAPGGAELRVVKIMNGMGPAVRHTVLPLWGNTTARKHIHSDIDVTFVEPPEPPPSVRTLPVGYFRRLHNLIRAAQPDVLLTYNFGALCAVMAGWLGRICPVVHNECGFGADEAVKLKRSRVLTRRVVLNRIFGVAVTSHTMLEIALQQFHLPSRKVHWIRTGVDVAHFRPGLSRQWRRQLGIPDDQMVFGFLGALRPEKNLPFLLRAFAAARLPNARLLLIGDGGVRAELEELAKSLELGDRILFAGYAPDPAAALAALDVFTLSSSTEQTSNSLLEAMACGLPAVVTDVGDSRVMLGDGAAGVVVPSGNEGVYASALSAMAQSADLRREWGERNRRRCLAEYPQESMIREYQALYYAAYDSR
jgi:glycosyltransferase involved in cell wall biosynthesis